jgi:hypothetical protein
MTRYTYHCHSKFRRVRPSDVRTLFLFVKPDVLYHRPHCLPPVGLALWQPLASLTPRFFLYLLSFISISLLFFQSVVPLRGSSFHYIRSQHYLQWDKWIAM